jgi:hypothetical protein
VCVQGNGVEMSTKSWFPLPWHWESLAVGENYGRWTVYNEAWFMKRKLEIDGGGQPRWVNKWRDQLRGDKDFRKMKKGASTFATEFVEAHQEPERD